MQHLTIVCLCLFLYVHKGFSALDVETFRQEVLNQHNIFRKDHCALALQRNSTLDAVAQSWSKALADLGKLVHSNTTIYGENSYYKVPFNFLKENGTTPVIAWYSEKSNYTVATPSKALHFTQLVWKNTKQLGVGITETPKNNGLIVVVNYFPRGNYENQFAQNVGC